MQILIIEPLFEESNRCRRLIAEVMRGLDRGGVGSRLADLPGAGESLVDISGVSVADWREAVADYAPALVASFRGGALLDDVATNGILRFAPETGERIVRDLKRASLTSADATLYAGHALGEAFLEELQAAMPLPSPVVRTVRLESDPGTADLKIEGSPLWRRAEPGEDPAMSAAIVADLLEWVKQCGA